MVLDSLSLINFLLGNYSSVKRKIEKSLEDEKELFSEEEYKIIFENEMQGYSDELINELYLDFSTATLKIPTNKVKTYKLIKRNDDLDIADNFILVLKLFNVSSDFFNYLPVSEYKHCIDSKNWDLYSSLPTCKLKKDTYGQYVTSTLSYLDFNENKRTVDMVLKFSLCPNEYLSYEVEGKLREFNNRLEDINFLETMLDCNVGVIVDFNRA